MATGKTTKYSDEVKDIARRVKHELGEDGFAPGSKQVEAVLKKFQGHGGNHATVEAACGMTPKELRAYVRQEGIGARSRRSLAAFAGEVGEPYARNRNLAAILVVLHEEKGL